MSAYKIGDCVISDAIINDYEVSEDGQTLYLRLLAIGANKDNIKLESGSDYVRIKTTCKYDEEFNENILLKFTREVDKVAVRAMDGFMFIEIYYVAKKSCKIQVY